MNDSVKNISEIQSLNTQDSIVKGNKFVLKSDTYGSDAGGVIFNQSAFSDNTKKDTSKETNFQADDVISEIKNIDQLINYFKSGGFQMDLSKEDQKNIKKLVQMSRDNFKINGIQRLRNQFNQSSFSEK